MKPLGSVCLGVAVLGFAAAADGCARISTTANDASSVREPADAGADAAPAASDGAPPADRSSGADRASSPPDALVSSDVSFGGADATCATQSAMAETLPLDLYVMMDSSSSMAEMTTAGTTKWQEVRTALTTFFNDPQSAGIGVGLQYFPLAQPGVPDGCTSDGMCNGFGPCDRYRVCYGPATTAIMVCRTDGDCRSGESCVPLGTCPIIGGSCAPIGALCPNLTVCGEAPGVCRGHDRCDPPAYATPAVAIAPLPGAAAGLASSLTMHQPGGGTPSGPALAGAIQQAQARAAANPDHKVAVLLVTDGLPSECDPLDVPAIAALAATAVAAKPPVVTFVIGVFGADEVAAASTNLDRLAMGGGTGAALIIDTSKDVTPILQRALAQIRTSALACEYRIPPASGGAIDFDKVNMQVTGMAGAAATIGHVTSKAGCDPARGGWYYDVDPAAGTVPSSIIACDATCTQLRGDPSARVDIVLGCQTITIF